MNVFLFPPTHGSGLGEQFRRTVGALGGRDWRLESGDWNDARGDTCEVVHLFDVPDVYAALPHFLTARHSSARVVVSPIYWNAERFYRQGLPLADPPQGERAELEQKVRVAAQRAEGAIQRVIFRHADMLIPNSNREAELLARDFDVPRERMIVAPNGVAPEWANASPDEFVRTYGVRDFVLCAARADARKNQLSLIRALQDEPLTLVLAGGSVAPGYWELCQREAQHARAHILFLPALAPHDLASAYAAARVHALVSWYDCAPLAALEAAAAGCNIVLTTESGASDYFGDDVRYCDPGDLDSIRWAVTAAYAAPRQTEVRDCILHEYTWTRAAEHTRCAYQRAMQLEPRPLDQTYGDDVEAALSALAALMALQAQSAAELFREKDELARTVRGLVDGRVMRALTTLNQFLKRRT